MKTKKYPNLFKGEMSGFDPKRAEKIARYHIILDTCVIGLAGLAAISFLALISIVILAGL